MSERELQRAPNARGSSPARAPAFQLPGTNGGPWQLYRLSEYTREGVTLVGFYPHEALQDAAFLSWFQFAENTEVLVVSNVECATLDRTRERSNITFPILGDPEGRVALEYGADFETETGTVFLVDSAERICCIWTGSIDPRELYTDAIQYMNETPQPTQRGAD